MEALDNYTGYAILSLSPAINERVFFWKRSALGNGDFTKDEMAPLSLSSGPRRNILPNALPKLVRFQPLRTIPPRATRATGCCGVK